MTRGHDSIAALMRYQNEDRKEARYRRRYRKRSLEHTTAANRIAVQTFTKAEKGEIPLTPKIKKTLAN